VTLFLANYIILLRMEGMLVAGGFAHIDSL